MTVASYAHPEDVRGWGGTRGSGMGNAGYPPEMEGRVLGDRDCGGVLEVLCGGGELLDKDELDPK